jgi:hypothetical protein
MRIVDKFSGESERGASQQKRRGPRLGQLQITAPVASTEHVSPAAHIAACTALHAVEDPLLQLTPPVALTVQVSPTAH